MRPTVVQIKPSVIEFMHTIIGGKYAWSLSYILVLSSTTVILNNIAKEELIILKVPAGSLKLDDGSGEGLRTRKDEKHNREIDLLIKADSMQDHKTKVDFSPYVIKKIGY